MDITDRKQVEAHARKYAQHAIANQYTSKGEPKLRPSEREPRKVGDGIRGQIGKDLRELSNIAESLRFMADSAFYGSQSAEAGNWESTKALYALGRTNFIKTSRKITALAVMGVIIGAAGFITAIKAYQK